MKYLWHRITGEGTWISFAEISTNTNSYLAIIPSNYISGMLREGRFAGHLIKSNTIVNDLNIEYKENYNTTSTEQYTL